MLTVARSVTMKFFVKDSGLLPQTGKFVVQKRSMRKSCS